MQSETMRLLVAWLHVLGVAVYVGGSIAMEFILGPAQKAIPPAQAQVMGKKTADRFLWFVWGALLLIVTSGVLRLYSTGLEKTLFSSAAFDTSYGRTLVAKVALWLVLLINGAIITFVLRPKLSGKVKSGTTATGAQAHQQGQIKSATWVMRLSRVDLGIALVIMVLGESLNWGGLL